MRAAGYGDAAWPAVQLGVPRGDDRSRFTRLPAECGGGATEGRKMVTDAEAMQIKDAFSEQHLGRNGICAVGIGRDEEGTPVLVVHVDAEQAEEPPSLPSVIDGLAVRIERTGPFRAQSP